MQIEGEEIHSLLSPLRNLSFRRLWISSLFSSLSAQIFPICATLLLLKGEKPALAISLLLSSQIVAYLIFSPIGGLLADRFSRMRLVRISLFLRFIAALQLLVGPTPEVSRLTLTVFIMGMIDAGSSGAGSALLPDIIEPNGLQAANALRAVTGRMASISGPGIAIFLVSTTSAKVGFSVTAVGMLLALTVLMRLKVVATQQYERESFRTALLAGYTFVKQTKWMLTVMIILALQTSILFGAEMVLLPIISTREFESARIFPLAIMALSLGSLISAAFAAKFRAKQPGLVAFLSWSFLVFLIIALIFPISPVFLIVCYFLGGLATEPMGIFWQTALQRNAPVESRARVMSFESMLSKALMPIGVGLAGPLSDLLGEKIYLSICVLIFLMLSTIALSIPSVRSFSSSKNV
jgi:MFS family permease